MATNLGGPQTPTGQAIAARNATTHGLFARDVVLTQLGEDPAAFDALLEQLMAQLPPRHLLERHYLEQIAAASWRLRRLHRWQAQIYEDETLTEDQRLDKLDKVLRHETALTRQIDRAIRMMNRDLAWLFQNRARDEALYQQNVTEADLRGYDELAIAVQQRVWRQVRSASPDADLDYSRLDNTQSASPPCAPPPPTDNPAAPPFPFREGSPLAAGVGSLPPANDENCQNEPPAPPASATEDHPSPIPLPPGEGWPRNEAGVGSLPDASQNCQNEPLTQSPSGATECHQPSSPSEGGKVPQADRGPTPAAKLSLRDISTPEGYSDYRKREEEMYRRLHPNAPPGLDWDDPEIRQAYGAS